MALLASLVVALTFRAFATADFIEGAFNTFVVQSKNTGARLKAGFFTPYYLSPGGGELYFLTSALALLNMGYDIEIILRRDNVCLTSSCIDETLHALRVPMTSQNLTIKLIPVDSVLTDAVYDIFYAIGNSKYPTHPPIGKFNIYMCQFPFDTYKKNYPFKTFEMWSSFDQVIVNSRFSHDWYVKSVHPATAYVSKCGLKVPTLTIVHPPVKPFHSSQKANANSHPNSKSKRSKGANIVLIGESTSHAICPRHHCMHNYPCYNIFQTKNQLTISSQPPRPLLQRTTKQGPRHRPRALRKHLAPAAVHSPPSTPCRLRASGPVEQGLCG